MSVTYRSTALPSAKNAWGPPVQARKTWGYFGANGAHNLHGGTRARIFSVSGIAPTTSMATFDGWQDGSVGDAVIDGTTYSNVLVVGVAYGNRFTNADDATQYTNYTILFEQLLT